MLFSTEFPTKLHSKNEFVKIVIDWIGGIKRSSVLKATSESEIYEDYAFILAEGDEELKISYIADENKLKCVGFLHKIPDEEGRVWQTESVLDISKKYKGHGVIRFRSQCLARKAGVRLFVPKVPYIIKLLLNMDLGGKDNKLKVCNRPIWLGDGEGDLALARDIMLSIASSFLPIIYISSIKSGEWILSKQQIEKMAFDLGGVAHVVVEKDRNFSFSLRDEVDGKNVYGGSIGFIVPKRGIFRRFYMGVDFADKQSLIRSIRATALEIRSLMPAVGLDWAELQEEALRARRKKEKGRLDQKELEEIYESEISILKDKIEDLRNQISLMSGESIRSHHKDDEIFIKEKLISQCPEIYPGEISDRIRFAINQILKIKYRECIDKRTEYVLSKVLEVVEPSPALKELKNDLKMYTKDKNKVCHNLKRLLSRHGYKIKSEKTHVVMEADSGFGGLENITISKTPSEHRGLKNLLSQIQKKLGINRI